MTTPYLCDTDKFVSPCFFETDNMKIAIPTNDGLTLCKEYGHARGFLIITTKLGEIVREEMRWNKLSDILCSSDGILSPVSDCQVVIVNGIGATVTKLLAEKEIEVIRTGEAIITNAYVHFLEDSLRKEANTTCCP